MGGGLPEKVGENVEKEADADGTVGYIKGGIVVGAEDEIEKIDDFSGGNSIDEIAGDAAGEEGENPRAEARSFDEDLASEPEEDDEGDGGDGNEGPAGTAKDGPRGTLVENMAEVEEVGDDFAKVVEGKGALDCEFGGLIEEKDDEGPNVRGAVACEGGWGLGLGHNEGIRMGTKEHGYCTTDGRGFEEREEGVPRWGGMER